MRLGLIAMSYGNIYVASVAMGAKDEHTLRAFVDAESYPGPSLIIAYSHCIAHGIALDQGVGAHQQKLAVDSGQWLLYRYDPRRAEAGENPLQLDSPAAKVKLQEYLLSENRFKMLTKSKPDDAKKFFAQDAFVVRGQGNRGGGNRIDLLHGEFVAIPRDVWIIFDKSQADIERVPNGMVVDCLRVPWLRGR